MSIAVSALTKTHPGRAQPTLRDVSFDVGAGTIVAIVGKSGAGKSTLLRCLSGLEGFDGGEIAVDGVVVRGGERPDRLRGHVGLVFQSLELFPHKTVLQNCILAPALVKRMPTDDAVARARELLRQLDLTEHVDAWPERLSGGQKQRVAIARALMMEPGVLLYDEPTSALDPALKLEVARTLRRVQENTGMTQVLVTHDPHLARELCSEAIVIEGGCIVRRGPPASVL